MLLPLATSASWSAEDTAGDGDTGFDPPDSPDPQPIASTEVRSNRLRIFFTSMTRSARRLLRAAEPVFEPAVGEIQIVRSTPLTFASVDRSGAHFPLPTLRVARHPLAPDVLVPGRLDPLCEHGNRSTRMLQLDFVRFDSTSHRWRCPDERRHEPITVDRVVAAVSSRVVLLNVPSIDW